MLSHMFSLQNTEALPGGGSHVARLNFKMSRVGVYKCLSLIVGFAVTVVIWPREVVSCCDFILLAVASFWVMSLVGIYPGRASVEVQNGLYKVLVSLNLSELSYMGLSPKASAEIPPATMSLTP